MIQIEPAGSHSCVLRRCVALIRQELVVLLYCCYEKSDVAASAVYLDLAMAEECFDVVVGSPSATYST